MIPRIREERKQGRKNHQGKGEKYVESRCKYLRKREGSGGREERLGRVKECACIEES